jgi:hypothetical protein
MALGVEPGNSIVSKDKTLNEVGPGTGSSPQIMVAELEDYLINGRPNLNGRLEKGLSVFVDRSKNPGSRSGLCGVASRYAIEIADKAQQQGRMLSMKAFQADLLGNALERVVDFRDQNLKFRGHGFNILIEEKM